MPTDRVISTLARERIDRYWRDHFGMPQDGRPLCRTPARRVTHGGELLGYTGLYALFTDGGAVLSSPPHWPRLTPETGLAPAPDAETFALACAEVPGLRVIGPAWLGYCEHAPAISSQVRIMDPRDEAAMDALRKACGPTAWDHGGPTEGSAMAVGLYHGGELASLASYEVWGGVLAHVSVVTAPDQRGKGYAGDVVASARAHALSQGLLPQYRTLLSNAASLAVGRALGFIHHATSVAVRPMNDTPSAE